MASTGGIGPLLVALSGDGATAVGTALSCRAAGRSGVAAALAVVGSVLVAGGRWASLFVLRIVLARAGVVPTSLGGLLAVGGAASMAPAPEPLRLLIIGIGVTLAARSLAADRGRVPAVA